MSYTEAAEKWLRASVNFRSNELQWVVTVTSLTAEFARVAKAERERCEAKLNERMETHRAKRAAVVESNRFNAKSSALELIVAAGMECNACINAIQVTP